MRAHNSKLDQQGYVREDVKGKEYLGISGNTQVKGGVSYIYFRFHAIMSLPSFISFLTSSTISWASSADFASKSYCFDSLGLRTTSRMILACLLLTLHRSTSANATDVVLAEECSPGMMCRKSPSKARTR